MNETLTGGDNSPSLCLDYHERSFLVPKTTPSDEAAGGRKFCIYILKPNFSC